MQSEPAAEEAKVAKGKSAFRDYLRRALCRALRDEESGADNGNLRWMHDLARRGARVNWTKLTPRRFLEQYLWCVGSIQKDYALHEAYFPAQVKLFRRCDPKVVAREREVICAEWAGSKCYLSGRMVEAVLDTATRIAGGWGAFQKAYLAIPDDADAEEMDAWWPAYHALDSLPMVGDAIAWYLIRNLYGAPFFKPDLHINAIAAHFFGVGKLDDMAAAVRRLWPVVCDDPRLSPVHLGEADYILWWYRQATNEPPAR